MLLGLAGRGLRLSEGVIASKAEPTTLAFGALTAFGEASVAQALNDLSVARVAVPAPPSERPQGNPWLHTTNLQGRK